jgi:hypothetical protein
MRFKTRGVFLALVAVFAMSAVAATAASAVKPEFTPVPAKKKFTVTGGTSSWTWGAPSITCAKTSATGEIVSAETVGNVIIVYSGCKSSSGAGTNCPANSVGAKAEEIVTKPLTAELGTISNTGSSGVGLLLGQLTPKWTKWFTLEKNKCTVEETFGGDLAAEYSGLGKQATHKLLFRPGTTGEKIKEIALDSGLVEKPEFEVFGAWVSIEAEDELKFEEPVEIT